MDAWTARARTVFYAYLWSTLIWMGLSPVLAGQDRVRLLERGITANYWTLILVNGAWLLTAGLLTPPIFFFVHRFPLTKRVGLARLAAYIGGCVPYVLASACIRWIVLPPWNPATQAFTPRTLQELIGNVHLFGNQIWDYAVTLIAAQAWEYFRRTQNQELERAELQQALVASELQSLRSQLHPHFLFNTLQGISTLVDGDPARAKAMIVKLSGLLRIALEHGNSDLITLTEELKFVEAYLALEKMRLEDRLGIRYDVLADTYQMLVPQMILQPLIENAIVHGIACCREGGWLHIAAGRVGQTLQIVITNSVGPRTKAGMGLGLQNTRARLKHLYGEEGTVSLQVEPAHVAVATLRLPAFSQPEISSVQTVPSEKEMVKEYAGVDRR